MHDQLKQAFLDRRGRATIKELVEDLKSILDSPKEDVRHGELFPKFRHSLDRLSEKQGILLEGPSMVFALRDKYRQESGMTTESAGLQQSMLNAMLENSFNNMDFSEPTKLDRDVTNQLLDTLIGQVEPVPEPASLIGSEAEPAGQSHAEEAELGGSGSQSDDAEMELPELDDDIGMGLCLEPEIDLPDLDGKSGPALTQTDVSGKMETTFGPEDTCLPDIVYEDESSVFELQVQPPSDEIQKTPDTPQQQPIKSHDSQDKPIKLRGTENEPMETDVDSIAPPTEKDLVSPLSVKARAELYNQGTPSPVLRERARPLTQTGDRPSSTSSSSAQEVAWFVTCSNAEYHSVAKVLNETPQLAPLANHINGFTALHWAARKGNVELIKLLAGRYKVDANRKTNLGHTPLHQAAMFNRHKAMHILSNVYGAQSNIRDHSGRLPEDYLDNKQSTMVTKPMDVYQQRMAAMAKTKSPIIKRSSTRRKENWGSVQMDHEPLAGRFSQTLFGTVTKAFGRSRKESV